MTATTVEIRCPVGPQRLLSKLRLSGEEPHYTDDNLIEFACADCRRILRQKGQPASLVLHRFNFLGEHVEDEIQP